MNTKTITRLKQLKNIGDTTAHTLVSIGITCLEDMQRLGPEGIMLKIIEIFGFEHPHVHTCFLYAVEGAIHDKNWLDMTPERKTELQHFLKNIQDHPIFG